IRGFHVTGVQTCALPIYFGAGRPALPCPLARLFYRKWYQPARTQDLAGTAFAVGIEGALVTAPRGIDSFVMIGRHGVSTSVSCRGLRALPLRARSLLVPPNAGRPGSTCACRRPARRVAIPARPCRRESFRAGYRQGRIARVLRFAR